MASVWIDGKLFDEGAAHVSVSDHGLTTGDGVFETMEVVGGVPFAIRRHLERLGRSAAALGLGAPDVDRLRDAMAQVVASHNGDCGRVRITLTGGLGPLGSGRGAGGPTTIVVGGPATPWPPTTPVVTVPWPRNERGALVGVKSTSYAENVLALARAHEAGAGEAIFANTVGHLCEGTGTNVFVVTDGRLLTPPLSSGCLAGVTRDLVIELLAVEEVDMDITALADADEAFLTSSTRRVQPISHVDGRALPVAPGPLTKQAMSAFDALIASTPDP